MSKKHNAKYEAKLTAFSYNNPELIAACAKHYAERYNEFEIRNFIDNSSDAVDIKSLNMALNIQEGKYGTQTELAL